MPLNPVLMAVRFNRTVPKVLISEYVLVRPDKSTSRRGWDLNSRLRNLMAMQAVCTVAQWFDPLSHHSRQVTSAITRVIETEEQQPAVGKNYLTLCEQRSI